MADTVKIDDQDYEVIGTADDGLPIIKGIATSTHHKDEQGNQIFDEDGNPKISVDIQVPSVTIMATPGEVK